MEAAPHDTATLAFTRILLPWRKATIDALTGRQIRLLALGLLIAIGICDYFAGMEVAFTLLLYLLPVCLVTWRSGFATGLAFAALATATTTLTALGFADRTRPWYVASDAIGTFGVLATVVFVLDKLRAYVEWEHRQRRIAVDQLRHAERLNLIGKLAAGMAHELGTPLSVIAGSAELLETRRLAPERRTELIQTIYTQTKRMSRTIRQLLDFGRAGGTSKTPVELNELVSVTTDLLAPVATERGCTIRFEPSDGPIAVFANASEIEQVLSNLVLNGMQAMPNGGELRLRTTIDSRAGQKGELSEYACVIVEDDGIGISPEDLPHIFDPFFTTKDVGEGTGLGLSITYGIVQDHGGFLEVESRRGGHGHGGTRFGVLLPLPETLKLEEKM